MGTSVKSQPKAASVYVHALRQALADRAGETVEQFTLGVLNGEMWTSQDSVWCLLRRSGKGGLALRAAYIGNAFEIKNVRRESSEVTRLEVKSALGTHSIAVSTGSDALDHLRLTVRFIASAPLLIPYLPRDLYPLGIHDDPLGAEGVVEAGQRGLNTGLLYFRIDEPAFGNILYVQNLTAMNGYYHATATKPDGAVGGIWPELGYLPPTPLLSGSPPGEAIPAGKEVTLSDAILAFRVDTPSLERESARQFLQMLGTVYRRLDLPRMEYRDWMERAEKTLRDLDQAPQATIRHYGHRYVHPYVCAEYPDIMVQMSIVAAIHDWGRWHGRQHPLETEFRAGLRKFFDPKLGTLRRYLPNVGDDKDADAVDSWYLYHPLLNLGRLSLHEDAEARQLFFDALEFGIKSARHFDYRWPIQYKITDFSVITESSGADGRGQTDVGGVFAWVMLQAFELSGEQRYLDEARAAIDAALGLRFNLNYQANLTAWGAAACMRLWRVTSREVYLEQSYVYVASFFQNCAIWESQLGHACHYKNFLGATCLQDAPYMAIYECFDSFTAFENYLIDSGPDLDPAVRMLVSEYCKYALDRAWFYYPDALPPDALSPQQREGNGHIEPALNFPVEDLYVDGQPAGQVGQEVYGAGAAFVFATRAFHAIEGAPFRLYCDHFVRASERINEQTMSISLDGGETCVAGLSLVRLKRRKLPSFRITTAGGDVLRPAKTSPDRIDYRVPASGRLIITW